MDDTEKTNVLDLGFKKDRQIAEDARHTLYELSSNEKAADARALALKAIEGYFKKYPIGSERKVP